MWPMMLTKQIEVAAFIAFSLCVVVVSWHSSNVLASSTVQHNWVQLNVMANIGWFGIFRALHLFLLFPHGSHQ